VEPEPGRFDWSWTDEVLPYLVEDCGIRPIVDLIHYGAPLWLDGTFLSPDYPARVAAYAAAVAERYGGLATDWTPLNEPRVHAHFSGRSGIWPPYRRGDRGYAAVLVSLAMGMQRTIAALRAIQPHARMIHVDAALSMTPGDLALEAAVTEHLEQQFLAAELVEGSVTPEHPMWSWLRDRGVPETTLQAFHAAPERFDVMGANYYPQMSASTLVHTPAGARARRRIGDAGDFEATIRRWHDRWQRPVMVTETSVYGSVGARQRWLDASVEAVGRLLDDGVPVEGYTWFPAFSLVSWNYRRGRRPLSAYLLHFGMWDLHDDGTGRLVATENALADQLRRIVAVGAPSAGRDVSSAA
jgi:beta-glucosidase/6-phospho-beta-glucosidase/beta-galactosidase